MPAQSVEQNQKDRRVATHDRWEEVGEVEAVIAGLEQEKGLGQDVHSSAQHLWQHGHLMHRQTGRNTTSGTIGMLKMQRDTTTMKHVPRSSC